jgi:hypothetical protein
VVEAKSDARAEFFREIGNRIIESNHLGEQIKFAPDDSRIQPERIALANFEFQNRDVDIILWSGYIKLLAWYFHQYLMTNILPPFQYS